MLRVEGEGGRGDHHEMVKDTKSWPLFNRMNNSAIAHNLVDF